MIRVVGVRARVSVCAAVRAWREKAARVRSCEAFRHAGARAQLRMRLAATKRMQTATRTRGESSRRSAQGVLERGCDGCGGRRRASLSSSAPWPADISLSVARTVSMYSGEVIESSTLRARLSLIHISEPTRRTPI
eukprot:1544188-Pleurochrysis_carterae.AAC.2